MSLGYVLILLAFAAPNEAEYRIDTVQLTVNIQSNVYTYRITNHGATPIVHFEIPQHATYSMTAPSGWQISSAAGIFKAWTNDPANGIEPAKTGTFSMRVSSQGATLGELTAKVKFQDGREVNIPKVWAPAAESRWYYYWIAGILVGIFLLHYLILRRRRHRIACTTNDA